MGVSALRPPSAGVKENLVRPMSTNPLKTKPAAVLLGLTLACAAASLMPTASAACTAGDNVAGIHYAVLPCRGGVCEVENYTCVGLLETGIQTAEDAIDLVIDLLP